MECDNTFLSIFLLSVHEEIEQEEDFLNMYIYGNIFYNITRKFWTWHHSIQEYHQDDSFLRMAHQIINLQMTQV